MNSERTWTYEQATGVLLNPANEQVGKGYSGLGVAKNNPEAQCMGGVGPIPRGSYSIGEPHESAQVGPFAMSLTPSDFTNTFGRSDFLIHGDSVLNPGAASHGCIILPRSLREAIWNSGDHVIEVTHG